MHDLTSDAGIIVAEELDEEVGGGSVLVLAGHDSESPNAVETFDGIDDLVRGGSKGREGLWAVGEVELGAEADTLVGVSEEWGDGPNRIIFEVGVGEDFANGGFGGVLVI